MKTYCLTLDLVDRPELISAYEQYHQSVWPEIKESILSAGILQMDIYRFGNRLAMTMITTDTFSFEEKASADAANPKVQEWEKLMWQFQQPVPGARPGEKWVIMDRIFSLKS